MISELVGTEVWNECGPNGRGQDVQSHPHWTGIGKVRSRRQAELWALQEALCQNPYAQAGPGRLTRLLQWKAMISSTEFSSQLSTEARSYSDTRTGP